MAAAPAANGTALGVARDVVKVNNANLSELKNACDDALKRVRPSTLACVAWRLC